MTENKQTYVTLNNETKIPQFGLGVYMINGDNVTEKAVSDALSLGYRHIDTAHAYQNERGVGRAIRNSDIDRKDIWITSKLWPSDYGEEKTPVAIDKMLKRLDTDYIDLLLLHQQFGDYIGAWKAMEMAVKEGKVRSIGLSNFDGERLDTLLANAEIKPAVMQVELHPYYQQQVLRQKMSKYNTKFESWYPIGHGDPALINEPVFTRLADKYGKSNVQIILRWHIQKGFIIFPKSTNPEHIKQNIDIFDFELTPDEIKEIDALDKHQRYFTMSFEAQKAAFSNFKPAD